MNNRESFDAINNTPILQSLLYDLNLLPEQLKEGTKEWDYMLTTVAHWQAAKAQDAELIAELVEALEFYADKKNWHKDSQEYGTFEVSDYNIIYSDFYQQNQATRYAGNRAKQALAKVRERV